MRLIDADALKKQWSMADKCEDCPQNARRCQFEQDFTRMDICEMIDEAPTIGGWISVKDRMPTVDGEYIVYITSDDGEKCVTCDHWVKSSHERWFLFDDAGTVVTHWMPLPKQPKEEDNG